MNQLWLNLKARKDNASKRQSQFVTPTLLAQASFIGSVRLHHDQAGIAWSRLGSTSDIEEVPRSLCKRMPTATLTFRLSTSGSILSPWPSICTSSEQDALTVVLKPLPSFPTTRMVGLSNSSSEQDFEFGALTAPVKPHYDFQQENSLMLNPCSWYALECVSSAICQLWALMTRQPFENSSVHKDRSYKDESM